MPSTRTSSPSQASPVSITVGWPDLTEQRSYLVQYARRRLLDPSLAEDLVHDVFEAVVSGRARFGGRSALRSWLVAVLKHKIVDLIRQRSGHASIEAGSDDDDAGSWEFECPQPRPDEVAEQRQRLRGTLARLAKLPDTLRQVVELRVLQDRSTSDVCRRLAISQQNLFVRLHRARHALAC